MRGLHLFLQIFSIFIFFPVNLLSIDLSSISPDGSVTNISDEVSDTYISFIYDAKLEKAYLNSEMWTSEGTEQDPYLIKNYADLNEIAQKTLLGESFEDKYFRLNNDITVNTDITASNTSRIIWTPIGNNNTPFAGNFDGNNFTVSGVYLESSLKSGCGFFGKISRAQIKNLKINNSYIKCSGTVGGIVGRSDSSSITGASYSGNVSCYDYRTSIGGIVGSCNYTEIINCKNSSTVQGNIVVSSNGGIAGYSLNSIFIDCVNTGIVSSGRESQNIGGIIGYSMDNKILNCVNEGYITCNNESFYVGGAVGRAFSTTIENTYNIGQILGYYVVGGIVGELGGDITNCYNAGTVKAFGDRGSLFGKLSGGRGIENCYYLRNKVTNLTGIIGATNYSGTPFNTDQKLDSTCLINNVACYYLTDALNTWVEYKNLPDKYISWEKIQHINDDYPIHKNKVSNINAYYEISTTFGNGGKALTNYTRSSEGNSVNLIIYPNAGYETSSVTMNGVDITNQVTDNQYSWVQPNENIEFDVIFRETSVYSDLGKEGYSELIKIYTLNGENLLLVIPEEYIGGNLFVYDTTGSIMVNELINNTMMIVKSKSKNGIYIASIKAGALIQNQTFSIR